MAHTPGPWINDNGLVNGRESRERFAPAVSVDLFDASEYPAELREEMLANAALIAAAPEMLKALKNIAGGFINSDFVLSTPPDWHRAFNQLQEIAARAISNMEAA
jgi:hypothetical protein